jgi:alpha-L-fucosidase 2
VRVANVDEKTATGRNPSLWNDAPAAEWLEAFPIGNGQIGGMVFGGIARERIALNHERLWRGTTRERTTPDVAARLPEIQDAFFAGDMAKGAALAEEVLGGHGRRIMPYQPVGNLWLEQPGVADDNVSGYRRELDLIDGIATARWTHNGAAIRCEVFVSAVHNVLVVHLSMADPDGITTTVRLDRQTHDEHLGPPSTWVKPEDARISAWSSDCSLGFTGAFPEGISFATEARVQVAGPQATCRTEDPSRAAITVRTASAVTVVLASAVCVDEEGDPNPADAVRAQLDHVPRGIAALSDAHLAEHRPAMRRTRLDLPEPAEVAALPLRARLERLREGHEDPGLAALYFAFGRYLLLGSSRACRLPANLQGIWCEELSPPWQSDFHLNINLQMNYWPAEVTNLAECVPPLIAFIERFVPSARQAARDLYGADGVFMPHATDVWGRATPEAPVCDVWTGAAAWLAQHLWWHWEFSGDRAFLETHAYPYLKEVAAFWTSFLTPERREGHPLHGKLVTAPSNSPENSYLWQGERLRYGVGATMDLLLARESLTNALAASELLGVDADLRATWQQTIDDLAPLQIGRFGQLQEWLDDWEEAEPAHRHVSHLYGIFPGDWPTSDDAPKLVAAARTSLERRLAHGGGHTGWSRSWVAALWARFGEGDLAGEHLDELIRQFATNAMLDLHPPRIFQIDGNFGGTAAVAEMLVQSHRGVLRLLPALPSAWREGSVAGLRGRGQVTVALAWAGGALIEALLVGRGASPLTVQLPDDRAYTVRAVPIPGDMRDVDPWGAEQFAAVTARDGAPVDAATDRRRLSWTPDTATMYVVTPSTENAPN